MTRRMFFAVALGQRAAMRLSREENGIEEIPKPEGFGLRGPLKPGATDGSAAYAIGDHFFTLHPDCALKPGIDVLVDQSVVLELRRA